MQPSWMTVGYQRLMQIRQASNDSAPSSSATYQQHANLPFEQLRVDAMSFHGQLLSDHLRV
jgi:hypothetical protein